jgi:branched-chain amino acid transport system substrate-binding protein
MWTRRKLLTGAAGLTAGISGVAPFSILRATAQASEIKLALIAPLSGPWARDGELMRKGAQMAVDDINQAGGIKSLGGAKIQLVVADTGDTPEKAKNAAQRLVAQEPTLIGGSVGQVSAFGLAVTEVTERAGLPWLTWSYADQFTNRGFKYMFKTAIDASKIPASAMPVLLDLSQKATGRRPATAAIIADDTPASQGAAKAFAAGGLAAHNIEVVVNESFTPPISDATPIVQRVRSRKPDLILLLPSAAPDVVQFVNKFVEFKIDIATVALGNLIASPDMRNLIDGALLEKQMTIISNWTGKASQDVNQRFAQKYNEKWMTEGAISSYGDMWVLKEGLERAGKADRDAVADAIRNLDMTDGPARYYIGGRLKFDEKGQRVGAGVVIVEWLGGEVKTVYPSEAATAEPVWPKS